MRKLIDLRDLGCETYSSHLAIQEYIERPVSRLIENKLSMEARVLEVQNIGGPAVIAAYTRIDLSCVVGKITKVKPIMDGNLIVGLEGAIIWSTPRLADLGFHILEESTEFEHLQVVPRALYAGSGPSRILTELICFDAKVDIPKSVCFDAKVEL